MRSQADPPESDHSVIPAPLAVPVRPSSYSAVPAKAEAIETPPRYAREYIDDAAPGGLLEYWGILRRHKGTIIIFAFLGLIAAVLVALPQTPVYQAHASLEIQTLNQDFMNMKQVSPVSEQSTDYYSNDIQTHIKLLQSDTLLERVINKLKQGLEKIDSRGGTALYDAVVASAVHLKENSKLEKRVIFVVTDGDDNESSETLEQAVRHLQAENGPTVYAIGILEGEDHARHAKRALQVMCERTGGMSFLPRTLDEVDDISRTVAHDIRTQYTIGYKPTTPKTQGGYREVKVEAKSPDHSKLTVRTKSGYYAGAGAAAGAQ